MPTAKHPFSKALFPSITEAFAGMASLREGAEQRHALLPAPTAAPPAAEEPLLQLRDRPTSASSQLMEKLVSARQRQLKRLQQLQAAARKRQEAEAQLAERNRREQERQLELQRMQAEQIAAAQWRAEQAEVGACGRTCEPIEERQWAPVGAPPGMSNAGN